MLLTRLLLCSLLTTVPPEQAYGDRHDHIRQPSQQPSNTSGGTDDEKDLRTLKAGEPVKREIAGGQQHTYRVKLDAGHYLKAIVEQDGIDVVLQVSGPDGKLILEVDSESRLRGEELVSLVAEAAGDYRLTVQLKLNGALAGSYEIRITELRAATDNDRALHDARKQYEEALKLQGAGKYDEALPLAERVLEIRERLMGSEHPDVAAAINVIASIYLYRGEYAKAEPLYRRALEIREKALIKDHPSTATILDNMAQLYWRQGRYAEAESLLKRALAIHEKALGEDHPETATGLNNLATLYQAQGRHGEAEPLCQRALAIHEKALGKDHPDTAASLNNLALLHREQGKYGEAEPLYQRSLAICEKALGKDHPYTATSLNNLAALYWRQGRYVEAESLFKRALPIREKALGEDHPETATSLNNLAVLYREQGKYGEAEPLFKRALAIRERALGKDHLGTANSLHGLATLYRMQGKYGEAEPLYQRSIAIHEETLGKDHPDTTNSLDNLAELYRMQGKYLEAEPLYQRALAIHEKALGEDHPDTAKSLNHLAMLYMAKGDLSQAVKFQSRANAASESHLARNLVIGSEREKLAYLATLSEQTDRTISLHFHSAPDDTVARSLAATIILQRKGRALDATSENLNALRSRFNAEDQALLDRLTETRSQIARLVLGGPRRMTIERHRDRIKTLEDQAERDEADISRRSAEFRAQSLPVTLEAVQAAIPADAALIEFASYRPFNAKVAKNDEAYGRPHYVAYVLRHNGEIQWKGLGEAKPIDKAIAELRGALRDPARSDVGSLARAVDQKIFEPLRPLLGELNRLLVSPDGPLNLIPFAALVDEKGHYLVERYSISYLTSGRDLLRLQITRENKNLPLVVANPDFGEPREVEMARLPGRNGAPLKDQPRGDPTAISARSAFSQFYFLPLPYTAREGEALRALLPGATLLAERQATKAALLQVRSPLLLHVATHGFFLDDLKLAPPGERGYHSFDYDPERLLKQIERSGIRIESPLLRSGLALAGANKHRQEDNGILTALEVTGLNLWGTKLVVLSACDTGVGEVRNGDGVYGLRRALVLAGSQAQVMSLWAVPDKATQYLMVGYYRRLKQGKGRGEALRQVQLEMLQEGKRRHPYHWASFIQSGEWANLDAK